VFAAVRTWVKKGAVIYDIGANVGVFAFPAAICAGTEGKVYAFEADCEMAALLTRSCQEQTGDVAPVVVCPFAISQTSGTLTFSVSNYRTAASSIQGYGRFEVGGKLRGCPCWRVDDLVGFYEPPALVKIDVEGAENLVLEGAMETLRRFRPVVLCECSGGETGEQSASLLRAAGYVWKPWEADGPFGDQIVPFSDIVALPAESADRLTS
jgi:FkbM family methyltransferase